MLTHFLFLGGCWHFVPSFLHVGCSSWPVFLVLQGLMLGLGVVLVLEWTGGRKGAIVVGSVLGLGDSCARF